MIADAPRSPLFLPVKGSTGSASSRASRIFSAGNPVKPRDLQKLTTDPALIPHLSAKSDIDWVMNCSGSSRIALAICRCARFRVGNRPPIQGNRLVPPPAFRDGEGAAGLWIVSFLGVGSPSP